MRSCLPCTACCSGALAVTIEGKDITPGNPCKYCDNGCTVHDKQPEKVCREFKCGWLTDPQLPEEMRPDLSGVIILQGKYHWMSRPVDMAAPVGTEIPPRTLKFIQYYADQENRPLLYCKRIGNIGRDIYPYGPDAFQNDISDMVKSGHEFK